MMLIAAIWFRCGHALAGFGPPFYAATLYECVGGLYSGDTVLLSSSGSRDEGQPFELDFLLPRRQMSVWDVLSRFGPPRQ